MWSRDDKQRNHYGTSYTQYSTAQAPTSVGGGRNKTQLTPTKSKYQYQQRPTEVFKNIEKIATLEKKGLREC